VVRLKAMKQILDQATPRDGSIDDMVRDGEIDRLASEWLNGDVEMTETVVAQLSGAGFSLNDVAAQSLTVQANDLDRIDQQVQRHEARRDAILQQIDRRREGFAQRVRRASEEAVDAEFVEAPSTAMALPTSGEKEGEA
jgi:hypothetical protein